MRAVANAPARARGRDDDEYRVMTGNVVFPSPAGGSAAMSPLSRTIPSYSVDAFSEFSVFAVSRMPSTSAVQLHSPPAAADPDACSGRTTQEQDEELFRDLFAGDSDWDAPGASSTSGHSKGALLQKKPAMHATPKTPVLWGSGVGGSSFLAPSPFTAPSLAEPTLSAPVPRLNLAELMNARPGEGGSARSVWGSSLGQVAEEGIDDEQDDSDECEERPESSIEPPSVRRAKLSKRQLSAGMNASSSTKLQQETLSFLEKLDLKALLHTPRPDVLDFYPTSVAGGAPTGPGNSMMPMHTNQLGGKPDDARVEHETHQTLCAKPTATGKLSSGAKRDTDEISARLSHMESTYGTTKSKTRKARKGTIERLANPILGHTSTLQALSPNQRLKREMALSEDGWNPSVSGPASAKAPQKMKSEAKAQRAASSGLDHLASSMRIYEAAAAVSSHKFQKPGGARETRAAPIVSSNQQDDARENETSSRDPLVKPKANAKKSLSARKAALRKKIQDKQAERSNQESGEQAVRSQRDDRAASNGATFLTQHEDEEERLTSRAKQAQPARPTLPPPATTRSLQHSTTESQPPRRPASVRVPKAETAPPSAKRASERKSSELDQPAATTPHRGDRSNMQKPSRPPGSRQAQQQQQHQPQQQTAQTAAPRKPSNRDGGKTSGRRPFARARPAATAAAPPSVAKPESLGAALVSKRKASGGKLSAAAELLMGTAALPASSSSATVAGNSSARRNGQPNGRQSRKAQAPAPPMTSATAAPRHPHPPRKQATNSSLGSATPKSKPTTTERSRRPSKDATSDDRALKNATTLPAITPSKARRGSSDVSGRRSNAAFRRVRAS